MTHAPFSPVPPHVRRTAAADPRWTLLDLVRQCRDRLGLRDRDITVLRGLLSLVPATVDPQEAIVFASNRVLTARCDGIDERTLRRRIEHLAARGLLTRRSSPNGKRYRVRDDRAEVQLTYGIDITPLFAIRDHLQALAEQCRRDELRRKALRAVIRDVLHHKAGLLPPALADLAQKSLRRVLTSDALQALVDALAIACEPADLTVSDSQNDRHIQRSDTDKFDSDAGENPQPVTRSERTEDITVDECLDLAPNAAAFAPEPPRDWSGVVRLSVVLAPALGLQPAEVAAAGQAMGPLGCALAVLGLVEAFGRIRNPGAYLHALAGRARSEGLDLVRMFRSLTKPAGPVYRGIHGSRP